MTRQGPVLRCALLLLALLVVVSVPSCLLKKNKPRSPLKFLKHALKKDHIAIEDRGYNSRFGMWPVDLWAPFRWEVKFGVYNEKRMAGLDGAIFGTELDERGADPFHFYGLYGRLTGGGMQVFASSGVVPGAGATNHGQVFYADTLLVEGVIETDGATMTFLARPAGSEAAYDVVGTTPFTNLPNPLNPGLGVFGFSDTAEVGFSCLRLPLNAQSPVALIDGHAELNDILDAALAVLDQRWTLAEEAPNVAEVLAGLRAAQTLVDDALASVRGLLPPTKAKTPEERAVKDVEKAVKRLGKIVALLEKRGDKGVKKAFKKLGKVVYPLISASDWVMPEEIRATIPETVRSLR